MFIRVHPWFHALLLLAFVLCGCAAASDTEPDRPSLNQRLLDATPGQRVDASPLELSEQTIPILDVTRTPADGPVFLLSDKPEYFRTGDGVALRERVEPGPVRIYSYHVPTPGSAPGSKAVTVLLENLGDAPLHLAIRRFASPPVGKDYHAIGKQGIVDFFTPLAGRNAVPAIEPGGRWVVHRAVGGENDLVHLWAEFHVDQPAEFTVFQTDADVPTTAEVVAALPELPQVLEGFHPSGAGRGKFEDQSDFVVEPTDDEFVYRTSMGVAQVVLADGDRDRWIEGTDGLTGEPTLNKGNYGVVYEVELPWESDDGRGLAVLVYNARAGGKWCEKQATAFVVGDSPQNVFPPGVVECPADAVRYGAPPEAVLVQRYDSPAPPDAGEPGEAGVVRITFTPPGASCLPAPLVLVPVDAAGKSGPDSP